MTTQPVGPSRGEFSAVDLNQRQVEALSQAVEP